VRPDLVDPFAVDGNSMETVFVGIDVSAIDDGEAFAEAMKNENELNLKAQ
jgi:hypothetical protein